MKNQKKKNQKIFIYSQVNGRMVFTMDEQHCPIRLQSRSKRMRAFCASEFDIANLQLVEMLRKQKHCFLQFILSFFRNTYTGRAQKLESISLLEDRRNYEEFSASSHLRSENVRSFICLDDVIAFEMMFIFLNSSFLHFK